MRTMMLSSLLAALLWATIACARPSRSSMQRSKHASISGRNSIKGSVTIEQVRNDAYRQHGPSEYAWAVAKYGKDLASHTASKVGLGSEPDPGTSSVGAFNQSYDREYLSPVYIGSPAQLCWLDLDTGSGDLWLFSSDTPAFYLDGQRIYHPEQSRTAVNVNNTSWPITYGDGSYASGAVYRDRVSLGNVTVYNATIESATSVSRSLTTDAVMSGILGLALNHSSTTYPRQPTLLDALAPQLHRNLFAADLKYQDAGSYHFGYIDETAYTGPITWQPVLGDSTFWEFYIQSIHIGGDNVWRMHNWPMVADTGTTLMLLPNDLVELYWSFVPGARLSEEYFGWVFPCNATLPAFDFGFADLWNATVPGHYFNFQNVSTTECYGGIQDSMEPFGILGDAFLKALYVIFDVDASRVGLATKHLKN